MEVFKLYAALFNLLPLYVGVLCLVLVIYAVPSVLSNCAIILIGKRELVVFLMYCDCKCYVSHPRCTVSLSVVYDYAFPGHTRLLFCN